MNGVASVVSTNRSQRHGPRNPGLTPLARVGFDHVSRDFAALAQELSGL